MSRSSFAVETYKGSGIKNLVIGRAGAVNDEFGLLGDGGLNGSHGQIKREREERERTLFAARRGSLYKDEKIFFLCRLWLLRLKLQRSRTDGGGYITGKKWLVQEKNGSRGQLKNRHNVF